MMSYILVVVHMGVHILLHCKYSIQWCMYVVHNAMLSLSYGAIPRLLSFSYIYVVDMMLLLMPSMLCCDWSLGSVPLVTELTDVRNTWALGLYLGLVLIAVHVLRSKEDRLEVGAGLALMVLPFLPASGAMFRVGFVVAER